ncbi:hypothetical protein [Brevibacterium renqingii]|uniref:hypothetical protein n=1 Tax=Brevibacterium renqingii TaxID=2776916 RepID=UPI001AE08743|nr:hypothetical protein [Brevibacterium renqingii]
MTEQSSSGSWRFAKQSWLLTAATTGLVIIASVAIMPAWGVFAAWFGFVYLVAFTLALLVLLVTSAKSLDALGPARRFGRHTAAGAVAVVLTLIYAVVNGALFSGTPTGTVVEIQLVHSALFFVPSLLIAGVRAAVQARKDARARSREDESARI